MGERVEFGEQSKGAATSRPQSEGPHTVTYQYARLHDMSQNL